MNKRILSLLLCLALCLTLTPAALAEDIEIADEPEIPVAETEDPAIPEEVVLAEPSTSADFNAAAVDSGVCGDDLTWTLDSAGVLTVSGSGDMWDMRQEGDIFDYHECPWDSRKDSIVRVVLEEGVASVGADAFLGCESLKSVVFPSSLRSVRHFAFLGCHQLDDAPLPEGLLSLCQQAFDGCAFTEAIIPASVSFLDNAFSSCPNLEHVYIGSDPSMACFVCGNSPFRSCQALKAIEVAPNHLALRAVDGVLYNGTVLLQYPLGKTDSIFRVAEGTVEIMRFAVEDADALQKVILPASLTSIDSHGFAGCDGLTEIKLSPRLEYIGSNAFETCSSLTSITIPPHVTTIDSYAFSQCGNLTEIRFTGPAPSIGDYCFCNVRATAYYPADDASWTEAVRQNYNGTITWVAYTPTRLSGWQWEDGAWYYYDQGEMRTGWIKSGGCWFYLDDYGVMQTGWRKVNDVWYYLAPGGAMQTGWQKIGGSWYYFAPDGAMQTRWQMINGSWYYLAEGGAMQTGWQKIGGSWYYMAPGGAMQTGWQKVGGNWYYFAPGGAMQTRWQMINGSWYYLAEGGAMQTGWQKIGGSWYYMAPSGAMQTGWQKIGGSWYYFEDSGKMLANTNRSINGKVYYFNASGICTNP
ncbi:MAG: leucine-rich repeat protein [Clostridia bacterium]